MYEKEIVDAALRGEKEAEKLWIFNPDTHAYKAKLYPDGELSYWKNLKLDKINEMKSVFSITWEGAGYIENIFDDKDLNFFQRIGNAFHSLLDKGMTMDAALQEVENFFREYTVIVKISNIINSLESKPNNEDKVAKGYKEAEFINYFSAKCSEDWKQQLLIDIKSILLQKPSDREVVAMAYLIYNCKELHKNMKPNTFKNWLNVFCDCWNLKIPTSKPNAVEREVKELKNRFYYLTMNDS